MGSKYRKWARRGIYTLIGLFAIAVLVPWAIPTRTLVDRLAGAVERATGRKLAVEGNVFVWLLPTPGISADQVTLANAPWAPGSSMVILDHVEARVRWLPLFLGHVEVSAIEIARPAANLKIDREGRRNWVFEKGARTSRAAPAPPPTALIYASSTASADDAPARRPAAAGTGFSLAGRPFPRWLTIDAINVMTGVFTFVDERSGRTFSADNIALAFDGLDSPARFSVNLHLRGQSTWRVDGAIGHPRALHTPGGSPVQAQVRGPSTTAELSGNVSAVFPFNGDVQASVNVGTIPEGHQFARLSGLSGSGTLTATAGRLVGSLRIKQPETATALDAAARVTVDIMHAPVAVDVRVDVPHFDLNRYLPRPGLETAENAPSLPVVQPGKPAPHDWPDKPLPLRWMKDVDASVAISAGPMALDQTEIGRTMLDVSLRDGIARASLAPTTLGTGRVSMEAEMDSRDPETVTVHIRVDGEHVPAALASRSRLGRRLLRTGTVGFGLDVQSAGRSARDLIGALRGEASVTLERGTIGVPNTIRALRGAASTCPQAVDGADLKGRIAIAGGVVKIASLGLRAPDFRATGTGEIDLPRRSLNLHASGNPASCMPPTAVLGAWNNFAVIPNGG